MYGICNLSLVPCRQEPANKSEMVNQLLFGDCFSIIEEKEEWIKIKQVHDEYESWINMKQYIPVKEKTFLDIKKKPSLFCSDLISLIHDKQKGISFPVVMGSLLPYFHEKKLQLENYEYEFDGSYVSTETKGNPGQITQTAFQFLNAPYLWGGRSALGIDCSGFTQIVYKVNGYQLPRDAWQQANCGSPLSFVEEAEPGDLAFFDNEEGKIIHVGIVLSGQQIIHASGCVRIDHFDHYGIFHSERKKYSHNLRVIKRVIA